MTREGIGREVDGKDLLDDVEEEIFAFDFDGIEDEETLDCCGMLCFLTYAFKNLLNFSGLIMSMS